MAFNKIKCQNCSWTWWLLLLIFFSFYFALGSYPLFDNNEGLYASIAKNMLLQRSFVLPCLNCIPYIEKPPLLYWLLSLSFSGFGLTAFAARLVTASSAVLLVLAIIYFMKKIKMSEIGVYSGLIFTSSIGVSIIARMVYFDMLFTLLVSSTLFTLFYWQLSQKTAWLRISYILLALALLTKGLIAIILVAGSFSVFLILEKDYRSFYRALDPLGILLFLALALPWHLLVEHQHPGFLKHYLIEEHFLRFLNQREPHDYYQGPIYYYLPRIFIYLLPWSLLSPIFFWRSKDNNLSKKRVLHFCYSWVLVPLIFFSLSSAKANYYMIVSVPALAIIMGIKIQELIWQQQTKILALFSSLALFLVAIALTIGFFVLNRVAPLGFELKLMLTISVIYSISAGALILTKIKSPKWVIILVAILIIPLVSSMVTYIKTNQESLSSFVAANYLNTLNSKPLYLYQEFEEYSALAFYTAGCFKLIATKSNDLYYGAKLPLFKSYFLEQLDFKQIAATKPTYIVVPQRKLEQFYQNFNADRFRLIKSFKRLLVIESLPSP